MSLDHVIAKQINPNAAAPLVLSVGAASTAIKEILSFSAPGTAFPATVNPLTVYNQLTGVFGTGSTGGGTGGTGGSTGQAAYLVKRKQSVLDLCKADLERYQSLKMSKNDKTLVQNWMDLLRTTETGITPGMPTTMPTTMPTASCSKTAAEAAPFNPTATMANVTAASPTGKITLGSVLGNTPDPVGDANLATSFTKGGDMLQNLIALSMICDTNRVILMLYPGYVTFNWDGIMHTHEHHGLSHRTGDFTVGGACGVTGVLDMINQIDQWYAGKYARLVGLLDSISESNGTLLDNTATMWLPELSDGAAHNLNNLPIVVAGKAGGYLKTGQVVNVEGTGTPSMGNSDMSCASGGNIGNTGSSGGNLPINKLYVTLMNAVGCKNTDGSKVTAVRSIRRHGLDGRHHQPRRGHQADVGRLSRPRVYRRPLNARSPGASVASLPRADSKGEPPAIQASGISSGPLSSKSSAAMRSSGRMSRPCSSDRPSWMPALTAWKARIGSMNEWPPTPSARNAARAAGSRRRFSHSAASSEFIPRQDSGRTS